MDVDDRTVRKWVSRVRNTQWLSFPGHMVINGIYFHLLHQDDLGKYPTKLRIAHPWQRQLELSNIVSPDMLVVHNIMSENILSDIVVAGVGELENTDLTTSNCDKQSSNFLIEPSLNFWIKPAAMLNH